MSMTGRVDLIHVGDYHVLDSTLLANHEYLIIYFKIDGAFQTCLMPIGSSSYIVEPMGFYFNDYNIRFAIKPKFTYTPSNHRITCTSVMYMSTDLATYPTLHNASSLNFESIGGTTPDYGTYGDNGYCTMVSRPYLYALYV